MDVKPNCAEKRDATNSGDFDNDFKSFNRDSELSEPSRETDELIIELEQKLHTRSVENDSRYKHYFNQ